MGCIIVVTAISELSKTTAIAPLEINVSIRTQRINSRGLIGSAGVPLILGRPMSQLSVVVAIRTVIECSTAKEINSPILCGDRDISVVIATGRIPAVTQLNEVKASQPGTHGCISRCTATEKVNISCRRVHDDIPMVSLTREVVIAVIDVGVVAPVTKHRIESTVFVNILEATDSASPEINTCFRLNRNGSSVSIPSHTGSGSSPTMSQLSVSINSVSGLKGNSPVGRSDHDISIPAFIGGSHIGVDSAVPDLCIGLAGSVSTSNATGKIDVSHG